MTGFKAPDKPEILEMVRRAGSHNYETAIAAQAELAQALELPLRQGVLVGDVVTPIFEAMNMPPGTVVEFPLDLLAPGEEDEFVAYTIPNHGRLPERHVEGDYVQVPTYEIGNTVDWLLKYARDARWDIVARATQVMQNGFTKKINDDGWHTVLSACADRNILVYDADASQGQFTKRLVSLMKVVMRRNGGGNTASVKRGRLTHLYLSPEGVEDMRNWGVDQIDEVTRKEIFNAADGSINRIFGVTLVDMDEFGEDQEYQLFFTSQLGASLESSDIELAVGLDLMNNDSFLMPVRETLSVYPDPTLHRQRRAGLYGWMELGFAVLDNRRVICASY